MVRNAKSGSQRNEVVQMITAQPRHPVLEAAFAK